MFNLGPTEIVVIVVVAILIFGPRLPQVAAEFGGWVVKFRRSVNDLRRESGIDREIMEARRQVENAVPREAWSFDASRKVQAGIATMKREVGEPVVKELTAARDEALLDRREPQSAPSGPSDQGGPHDPHESGASGASGPEAGAANAPAAPTPESPDPKPAPPRGSDPLP